MYVLCYVIKIFSIIHKSCKITDRVKEILKKN